MYKSLIFNNLEEIFLNKKNSHAYIFYTNNFDYCKEDVYQLVKNIFKVDNINLISSDFIVVPCSEKKNILKEDIVELRNFFQKTTYLNGKRLYLIEEAHKLNSSSANMILKFLEEPLDGVIAFFITTNLDVVLSTIKSRCQVINCFYETQISNNSDNIGIIDSIFDGNIYVNMFKLKKTLEKLDRNNLIEILINYVNYYYSNFDVKYKNRIYVINKAINMLNNNVNIDYVFDYICIKGVDNK